MPAIDSKAALLIAGFWLVCLSATFGLTSHVEESLRDSREGTLEATAPRESINAAATVPSHQQMAARIDALLEELWRAAQTQPAPPAGDGEFLRRAYLDFTGAIPRASEVRQFLADDRPEKRDELIDRLLASPRHATHMATTYRNRILPMGVEPQRAREAAALQKWLRTRFAKNLRYDNLVGELLLAAGGDELGPALFFQANDVQPEQMAATTAELFLGVDLHCAQCHDHPYADWSQRDFWGLAAFFARVTVPDDRRMRMGMGATYRLVDADRGEVELPDTGELIPPKFPRGESPGDDARQSRRARLAVWMTARENRFFSRAAVNWAWEHLFGRSLVDSIDEVDRQNVSRRAQLLDELAAYFVQSGFDLRELWRSLASTRAYQLSSRHDAPDSAPPESFARMLAKPLTPEQLYDSFLVVAPRGTTFQQNVDRARDMTSGLDEDPLRVEFVRRMRAPPGSATEYRAGTLQALMLMNGQTMAAATAPDQSSVLGALTAPFMDENDQVEALFLATLARLPEPQEHAAFVALLRDCETEADRSQAISDVLWALLNSTEFAFNH